MKVSETAARARGSRIDSRRSRSISSCAGGLPHVLRFGSKLLWRPLLATALGTWLAGGAGAAGAGADVEGFRTQMEKWVETQQIISEEQSDWEMDRQTLRATRDLLRDEKKTLEAEIAELQPRLRSLETAPRTR